MSRIPRGARRAARLGIPAALLAAIGRQGAPSRIRRLSGGVLLSYWTWYYRHYRRESLAATRQEYQWLRTANWDAYHRHYNERVPTVEEEFALWGDYHQHRHEMRYDLVADAVRGHLPPGGRVLDVGCGSALVADRLPDVPALYVGMDYGAPHVRYAAQRFSSKAVAALRVRFVRGGGEHLPFAADSFDVVVMSEVIEHLLQPEVAVWEVARVLRPGGLYVMTTNNASETPLRSPLTHAFAWVEKILGAYLPPLISRRPWVWPVPVDPELLPTGSPPVYLPHTHHIYAETKRLLAAAGLRTVHWSTFEFPPPQSTTARWLSARGEWGRRVVDGIEAVAVRVPGLNKMGTHHLLLARKTGRPVARIPVPGIWPGPFSGGREAAGAYKR